NQKKRAAKERQDAVRYGHESLARDLLTIIDDLDRALVAAGGGGGDGKPPVGGGGRGRKGVLPTLRAHGGQRGRWAVRSGGGAGRSPTWRATPSPSGSSRSTGRGIA